MGPLQSCTPQKIGFKMWYSNYFHCVRENAPVPEKLGQFNMICCRRAGTIQLTMLYRKKKDFK